MGGGLGIHEDLITKKILLNFFNCNLFAQSEINNLLIKNSIKKKNNLKLFI